MDPKACFGSCPTFYLDGDDDRPQAEGFSKSVARILEARDIDALYHARPGGTHFGITMRNEALETHAVRSVRLLAATRPPGGRVLATRDGVFHSVAMLHPPSSCLASDRDCLSHVLSMDGHGRSSTTDSLDLSVRETIEFAFDVPSGSAYGLVLGARHTFVSTYLFYQILAYLGDEAGEWLARYERGELPEISHFLGSDNDLAQIHIYVLADDGSWKQVGVYDEGGPLATDVQVIPLSSEHSTPVRVRLDLTRGFWRLEYAALAELIDTVHPQEIHPESVYREGQSDPVALATLRDPDRHLITYPGDTYRLEFRLPGSTADLELFLDSEGYYYEWMRQEWLAEKNIGRALEMLYQPDLALRRLAPPFKRVEADMERLFWESRFRR
jgi:hypothetical protein